jgi:hypothetical protein
MTKSFEIVSVDRRKYKRFNTVSTQVTVSLNPPPEAGTTESVKYFLSGMNDVFEHALQGVADID